jgi:hypothetical protein
VDLQLPLQSVSITTKIASWNPVHDEVYYPHLVKISSSNLYNNGCNEIEVNESCDLIFVVK